jgi:sulfonate transport system permease protein
MIGLGVAWSAVVGAEFLGTQTGLGFIEAQARQFALLDRMVVVGLCFLVYAVVSFLLFDILTRPLIRWMPTTTRSL